MTSRYTQARLLALAVGLVGLPALASFAVSPVRIQKVVTGKDRSVEFIISNSGDEPLQVTLRTAPLSHDRSGRPVEGVKGSRFDASHLIRLEQPTLELPPRRWKRIRAQVEVPPDGGGGYAFIYARAQPVGPPKEEITSALQVGVVVLLSFPGPNRPGLEIENARMDGETLKVAVRNTGDIHLSPAGRVGLIDAAGREVWSGSLSSANIFPGLVRELVVEKVPASLADGPYTLALEVSSPVVAKKRGEAVAVEGRLRLSPHGKLTHR